MRAFARAKLRPADVCDVEPCGTFDYKLLYYHTAYRGGQLAKGRDMRAFAGRSCGPPMACAIAIRTWNR